VQRLERLRISWKNKKKKRDLVPGYKAQDLLNEAFAASKIHIFISKIKNNFFFYYYLSII
jgi:hypothetical protein